jgi:hypothetical protein
LTPAFQDAVARRLEPSGHASARGDARLKPSRYTVVRFTLKRRYRIEGESGSSRNWHGRGRKKKLPSLQSRRRFSGRFKIHDINERQAHCDDRELMDRPRISFDA